MNSKPQSWKKSDLSVKESLLFTFIIMIRSHFREREERRRERQRMADEEEAKRQARIEKEKLDRELRLKQKVRFYFCQLFRRMRKI